MTLYRANTHYLSLSKLFICVGLLVNNSIAQEKQSPGVLDQHVAIGVSDSDTQLPDIPTLPIVEAGAVEFEALSKVVTAQLTVAFAEHSIGSYQYRHRAYNGGLVGPTIRVRPGDTLKLLVKNELPEESKPKSHDSTAPHGFNDTNLHTHGLHVSPLGEGDNVFIDIGPGEEFEFKFEIPPNHPAGTFWYHPHKHGSVALQVAGGMSGALIVEGGLDSATELAGVQEQVLVFQQFVAKATDTPENVIETMPADIYGERSDEVISATLINGALYPTIIMRPGELQRWRMVHAGLEDTLDLSIESHSFHEIAVDGLTTGKMIERRSLELQPGYRSDCLVQAANEPGEYYLTSKVRDEIHAVKGRQVSRIYIAKVQVEGPPVDMTLPKADTFAKYVPSNLSPILDDEIVVPVREISLSAFGANFHINDRPFTPGEVNIASRLGTAEEWKITSKFGVHPFHVHVNPFQVLLRDKDTQLDEWVWRDTIVIGEGETLRIRSRFEDFGGLTVVHCHNLDHEDKGMMGTLLIQDPAAPEHSPIRKANRGLPGIPLPVPTWSAADAFGKKHSDQQYSEKPYLLILHRGIQCIHCAGQLQLLAERREDFAIRGIRIVAVSPSGIAPEDVTKYLNVYNMDFPLLSDGTLDVFRAFGCLDTEVLHGAFLIDGTGIVRWQTVGDSPENDIDVLLRAADNIRDGVPKVVLDVKINR